MVVQPPNCWMIRIPNFEHHKKPTLQILNLSEVDFYRATEFLGNF